MDQREWLVEQVAAYIVTRSEHTGDFSEAVAGARVSNEHEQWVFDGPLSFSGRELEPHEQDSWSRYSGLQLDPEGFTEAVDLARTMTDLADL